MSTGPSSVDTGRGPSLASALSDAAGTIYSQDVTGCLAAAVGVGGLSSRLLAPQQLARWLAATDTALARLQAEHSVGALRFLDDADDRRLVATIETAYARLSADAGTVIFLGTGGASLGGQAIAQFGGWAIPGTTTPEQRRRPTTRFYDNLDAETLAALLDADNLGRFRFVIVSASGNTPETLAQAIAAIAAVRAAGLEERIPEHFLGVTGPAADGARNGVRHLLEHHGIPILEHPAGIGAPFVALTSAGLLAAVARGLDGRQLLEGARAVVAQMVGAKRAADVPAAVGAAIAVGLSEDAGVRFQVFMAYADRLMRFADWAAQLWAESLGRDGRAAVPISCGGPVDQYAQLQLAIGGLRTQMMTVVRAPDAAEGPRMPADLAALAGFEEISGRHVGALVAAQSHALAAALGVAGRPVRGIDLVRYDAFGLGALLMHFMIEVILAGYVLGGDPFDRPAAELGKRLLRARMAETR